MKAISITKEQSRGQYADIFAYLTYRKIKFDELATEKVVETIRNSADYKAWRRNKAARAR